MSLCRYFLHICFFCVVFFLVPQDLPWNCGRNGWVRTSFSYTWPLSLPADALLLFLLLGFVASELQGESKFIFFLCDNRASLWKLPLLYLDPWLNLKANENIPFMWFHKENFIMNLGQIREISITCNSTPSGKIEPLVSEYTEAPLRWSREVDLLFGVQIQLSMDNHLLLCTLQYTAFLHHYNKNYVYGKCWKVCY